jgi:hypothetical protein
MPKAPLTHVLCIDEAIINIVYVLAHVVLTALLFLCNALFCKSSDTIVLFGHACSNTIAVCGGHEGYCYVRRQFTKRSAAHKQQEPCRRTLYSPPTLPSPMRSWTTSESWTRRTRSWSNTCTHINEPLASRCWRYIAAACRIQCPGAAEFSASLACLLCSSAA